MTRLTAFAAPALMLVYGLCRFGDGLDGDRGNGWAWDVGHVAFFVAIILFVVLGETLRRRSPSLLTAVAEVAAALGAVSFLWVIAGDLFSSFSDAYPLPDVLEMIGPVLFQFGLLTLLVRECVARRLPYWSPILVLLGFVAIPISLDLLPISALVVGAGLSPLFLRRTPTEAAPGHTPRAFRLRRPAARP